MTFEEELARYEEKFEKERAATAESLHEMDFCLARGLPFPLTEQAIEVLAHSMTMSKLGPLRPTRKDASSPSPTPARFVPAREPKPSFPLCFIPGREPARG